MGEALEAIEATLGGELLGGDPRMTMRCPATLEAPPPPPRAATFSGVRRFRGDGGDLCLGGEERAEAETEATDAPAPEVDPPPAELRCCGAPDWMILP